MKHLLSKIFILLVVGIFENGDAKATTPQCDGNCYAFGDPHYQTFDCQKFDFHGQCSYILMKTCDESLPFLEIIGDNEQMAYHPQYALTKNVIIKSTGENIKLTANKDIYINDVKQTEDLINISNGTLTKTEHEIIIDHELGFKLTWGSPFKAAINFSNDTLKGKVCGMCGDANGVHYDDFVTPSKQKVTDAESFGDSWNVADKCGNKAVTAAVAKAAWAFGDWSECSVTCGAGLKTRTQVCLDGSGNPADGECEGTPQNGTEACNERACPEWAYIDNWTPCTVTCGGGKQLRTQVCLDENQNEVAADLCSGNADTAVGDCNTDACLCKPNPCQNEGTCSQVGNDAICACPYGVRGDRCETRVINK